MARAAIPQGYSGESLFTVWTQARKRVETEPYIRTACCSGELQEPRWCWGWGARTESVVIGCASLIRDLSLAPLLEAGLLLVVGWPRAKIWEGAAWWEPLPSRGVAVWAGAAASASACRTLDTALLSLWERRFTGSGLRQRCGSLPAFRCTVPPRALEGRQRREPLSAGPRTRGSRGSPRHPTVLYLSAPALLWRGAEAPEHRPSPSAASSTGKGQRRWRHREVRLDPWPPRCEL